MIFTKNFDFTGEIMNTITEKQREIPVCGKYDVFVAGGGIAGVSAALAAARSGADVILADKQCILGGLATSGLVTIYLPLCDGCGRQVSFSVAEELFKLSIMRCVCGKYPKAWLEGGSKEEKIKERYEVQFNPQLFAIDMERLLKENGVKIMYDTFICDTVTEDKKIHAVIVENKSGRRAYEVGSVVDATGDADMCKFAGAATDTFKAKNILAAWSYGKYKDGVRLNMLGYCESALKGKKALEQKRFGGIDADEISEMLSLSHTQVLNDFVKKRQDDNEYEPVTIATMPQLRMTRRICGKYVLDDSEMHKRFENSVGLISDWRKRGPVYEIPFDALYGEDVKNLICAGRCISVSDDMWDISRVIPACAVTGQAAGIAAAMSDDFSKCNIAELQQKLKSAGVVLHECDL